MNFIQHLLENTPSTKEKLLEVNSEDFLNVLLAAAGEEPLQESEMEGIPENMTVAELIDIYEGRMPPPRMNYSFDEVDPDVDAKSFSRSNAARRKGMTDDEYANRSEREHMRRGAQDAYDRRWGDAGEERMQHQMMHGTEEEEANAPAWREKLKTLDRSMAGDRRDISNKSRPSNKRYAQRDDRLNRRMGFETMGSEEEEPMVPARRDMMSGVPRLSDQINAVRSRKRERQINNRAARSTTGKNIPNYEKYPTTKTRD